MGGDDDLSGKRRIGAGFVWELSGGSGLIGGFLKVRSRRTFLYRRPVRSRVVAVRGQHLQQCSWFVYLLQLYLRKFEMADSQDWGGGGDDPEENTQRMIEMIWESLTDIRARMDQQVPVPPAAVPPIVGGAVPEAPISPPPDGVTFCTTITAIDKVVLATYQLRGFALEWWRLKMQTTFAGRIEETITWPEFLGVFNDTFFPVRARRTFLYCRPVQSRVVAVRGQHLQQCSWFVYFLQLYLGKFEMADSRDWGGGGDDPEENTQRMIERIWESLTDIRARMDQQAPVPPAAVPPVVGGAVPEALVSPPPGMELPFVPPSPPVRVVEEPVMQVEKFLRLQPPTYTGGPNPDTAEHWIHKIERVFTTMRCPTVDKVVLATYQLRGLALEWWRLKMQTTFARRIEETITWPEFLGVFNDTFFPVQVQQVKRERFRTLQQGNSSVFEYQMRFMALSRYAPYIVSDNNKMVEYFIRGLRVELQNAIVPLMCKTVEEAAHRATTLERSIRT
ncbi:hypothetical protein Taro_056265, partial [Colocasia esculenta]|nr:hypothetical protein [Colocasia esculenta]